MRCSKFYLFILLAAAFLSSNQLFSSEKRIDAAVEWGNGKVYFFRGNQYFRYDVKADQVDAGYPKPITNWSGVPWTDGIDAAVNWGNGKVYIFKGNEYVRFDIKADKVDPGYPKPIDQTT